MRSRSWATNPSPSSPARRNRRSSPRPLGPALLLVLDTLGPSERLAFVLHDLFGVPFEDIAPIVDRSPAAARQLASRARRRVQGGDEAALRRPPPPTTDRRGVPGRLPPRGLRDAGLPARPRRRPSSRPRRGESRGRQPRSGRSLAGSPKCVGLGPWRRRLSGRATAAEGGAHRRRSRSGLGSRRAAPGGVRLPRRGRHRHRDRDRDRPSGGAVPSSRTAELVETAELNECSLQNHRVTPCSARQLERGRESVTPSMCLPPCATHLARFGGKSHRKSFTNS